MPDKLKKLEDILKILKEDTVSMTEFKKAIDLLVSVVKNAEQKSIELSGESLASIQEAIDFIKSQNEELTDHVKRTTKSEVETKIAKLSKDITKRVNTLLSKTEEALAQLEEVKSIEVKDGKDADEEYVIESVLARIPKPTEFVLDGYDAVDKINELPTDNDEYKIDAKHIKNLPESKVTRGGGSTARNLYQLLDVSINNPTNAQVLKYNSTTGVWENGTGGGGGGGSVSVNGVEVTDPNLIDSVTTKISATGSDIEIQAIGIKASTSAGALIEASNGTDIGLFGAGNTANITWYGNHNFDTATQDTIAAFVGVGKTLSSLATATYPSLTELSYVKGVTSAIQTQLNAKLSTTLASANILVGNGSNVATAVAMSGDATLANTGALTIANNAVSDAKFRQSAGLSVVGRSANSTGNVADITAANDNEVLRRSGTSIGFGTVATGGIANSAVTYAKIQDVSATLRVLGRVSSGAGVVEEIVVDTDLSSVSANDDTVASAKAIKTYVDSRPIAIFSANYSADVAAAGVSRFLALTSAGLPDSGTENQRDFPVPVAGTAKNFFFTTTTAQSGTGSLVLTIRKNGADTAIVITVAAGSAAGQFSDTTNTATFAAGDTLSVKVTNNASTNSAAYNGASLAFY